MQFDQRLRRAAYRARRRILGEGVDHEPLVEIVGQEARARRGAPKSRPGTTLLGFVLTLALLWGVFAVLSAEQGRIALQISEAGEAPVGAANAAGRALGAIGPERSPLEETLFFLPNRREARLAAMRRGAAGAVGTWAVALSRSGGAATEAALAPVALLTQDPDSASLRRTAQAALNRRGVHASAAPANPEAAAAALALAAERLRAQAEAVRTAQAGSGVYANAAFDDAVAEARGEAYAWALLAPTLDPTAPLDDLVAAAAFNPRHLMNGPEGVGPRHGDLLAARLEAAAEALAAHADPAPGLRGPSP